ncbi:MAG: pyridoxal phosphate-dependent aminotransferase [Thermoplasmata archaeon]
MASIDFPLLRWLIDNSDVEFNLASSSMEKKHLRDICEMEDDIGLDVDFDINHALTKKVESINPTGTRALITSGAQSANSLICSMLGKGNITVEIPTYQPLYTSPDIQGMEVHYLKRTYDKRFKIDVDDLESCFDQKTRALLITNPHNPSGVYMTNEELKPAQEFLEDKGAYLIVDEIYRDFIEESEPATELGENVLVTTSLSKVYGLGGLRSGWITSKNEEALQELAGIKDQMHPFNSTLSEIVASRALEMRDALLSSARKRAETNLSMVKGWISAEDKIEWVEPSMGIISFPKLKDIDGTEFAERAYKEGVLVAPGEYFSPGGEFKDHVRLTFRIEPSSLAKGLQILSSAVKRWS